MKRVIFAVVMLCTFGMTSYADNVKDSLKTEVSVKQYDLSNVSVKERFAKLLNLDEVQMNNVEFSINTLNQQLKTISGEPTRDSRVIMLDNAFKENVKFLKGVLTDEQYKKYLQIMNATRRNAEIYI